MSSTGNIRGQRTQSSTGGYKTLGSSIASGNNSGAFKRIYINAFERYNGNSDLALSSTLGIQKGDYAHTNNYSFSTFKSASGPSLGDYKKKGLINTPQTATSLSQVFLGATVSSTSPCTGSTNSLAYLACQNQGNISVSYSGNNTIYTIPPGVTIGLPTNLYIQSNELLYIYGTLNGELPHNASMISGANGIYIYCSNCLNQSGATACLNIQNATVSVPNIIQIPSQ